MQEITSQEQPKWNAIILGILKKLISICEEHHIDYYCCGGTAIGAVRHHGMIPWDDDIDVFMPRPAYDRFIAVNRRTWEISNCLLLIIRTITSCISRSYARREPQSWNDMIHLVSLDCLLIYSPSTERQRTCRKLFA